MPPDSQLSCDVYRITFPNWETLHPAAKESIGATLLRPQDFFGTSPNRRGFAGLIRVDNTIAGFYVQEGMREGLEGESPTDLTQSAQANMEKLFFSLVLDAGLIILQRRRLTGYVTMSYTTMIEEFKMMLLRIVQAAGLQVLAISWEKFFRERSQEEMRQLFFASVALEVEVDDLQYVAFPVPAPIFVL